MHRPRSVLRTSTAVLLCSVLVGACVAKVHGATGLQSGYRGFAALATAAPAAGAPPTATAAFDGLETRVQQAALTAADSGAVISVLVHDRITGKTVSSGNDTVIATASVAKLFIADDLLYQASTGRSPLSSDDRKALDSMLEASDDDAGEVFWARGGGDDIVTRVASRYGLPSTGPGSDGRWWNTITTASDLAQYYDMLLDGAGGLTVDQADIIIDDLAQSAPEGVDGYPQRFGIPEGLFAERVAVKQGWMCCIGDDWMHLSTGVVGADRRYVMVVESLQASDDSTARNTITQAVKTMFPNGRI
ncbi:MAG: hypothetical protein JO191_11325 [Mycobacteriaceae bacterium]|nr:hypothetical protein [Mycobacteriaceae bacterium]